MGIPHVLRYCFNGIIKPMDNPSETPFESKTQCDWVIIDGHMLLYKVTTGLTNILHNENAIAELFLGHVTNFVNVLYLLTEKPIRCVYICFDGPGISKHKRYTQLERDRHTTMGLGILDRGERDTFIRSLCDHIYNKLYWSDEYNSIVLFTKMSYSCEYKEADIKIVDMCLGLDKDSHIVVLNNDSDIFISMIKLKEYDNLTILLDIPERGIHYVTTAAIKENYTVLNYDVLIFFIIFFCGCDYECPIISGTEKQMSSIKKFLTDENIGRVTKKSLYKCWLKLNPRSHIHITGLDRAILSKLIQIKIFSVTDIISYYTGGKNMGDNHPSINTDFYRLCRVFKNLKITDVQT